MIGLPKTLGGRFLAVNFFVAIVPMVILLGFTVPRTHTSLTKSLSESLKTKVVIAGHSIDSFLTAQVVGARVLSQADVLESRDVEAQIQYLTEVVEATPWIDDIDIISTSGTIICSSGEQNEKGALASDLQPGLGPVIRAAAKGKQGDVFVTEAIPVDSGIGVCFVTPITDDANVKVVSLLSIEVSLTAIEPLLIYFLGQLEAHGAKSVFLVANDGAVIAGTGANVVTFNRLPDLAAQPNLLNKFEDQGAVGSIIYHDADGEEVVAGYADLGEFGKNGALDWSIIATVPLTKGLAAFTRTANQSILFGISLALLAVYLGAMMSRSVVRRIGRLSAATAAVGSGDLHVSVNLHGDDELSDLSRSFNQMVERLRELQAKQEASLATAAKDAELRKAQASLYEEMRCSSELCTFSNTVIAFLVEFTGSKLGTLYIRSDDSTDELHLFGTYALSQRKNLVTRIQAGANLVGQVAFAKKSLLITQVPDDYIKVSSSLGEAAPRNLLVVPLIHESRVTGVIELGSFAAFDEAAVATVEKMVESVARAIDTRRSGERVQALLKKTQQQATALSIANDDLEEKSTNLKKQKAETDERNRQLQLAWDQVEEKAAQLEKAGKYKTEFLANMSHEIRTPMTAILGFSESLRDGGLSESEVRNAVHTIHKNGEFLLSIINDILDMSKIDAGKMAVEHIACSPRDIVMDVIELMKVRTNAKGLALNAECIGVIPETILSDPVRLKQILVNLIGNAVKFTTEGGVRVIMRWVSEAGESYMQFDIVDTGIGMSKAQAAGLFVAFAQADGSTTRKFGGTGLGLVISKKFAGLLGGDITVADTKVDCGTRFRATVATGSLEGVKMIESSTAAPMESKTEASPAAIHLEPLDCRILLAEDGPDNQRLISFVLKKAGAAVTVAENGRIAVDVAMAALKTGTPFDVILMDMQMPALDGYGAVAALRDKDYSGPIIALTAHAMSDDRQKCMDAGCDDFATKPIDRVTLIETIRRHLVPAEAV